MAYFILRNKLESHLRVHHIECVLRHITLKPFRVMRIVILTLALLCLLLAFALSPILSSVDYGIRVRRRIKHWCRWAC